MNPPPATAALLLSALVLCATSQNALRCQCPKVVDEKPRNIERAVKSISRLPAGPHCRNEQVIASVLIKSKATKVCFSPAAPWVKELEAKIIGKPRANATTATTAATASP
ncbi:interleukin-8-like [Denticeps clupeoides]|uniref:interleukin-8-like n=1 Tax=Denticeps clupeoides TaxID=299321 RepID=UPI0010A49574|nr:interleukin-8-like [Denticeps clupeoides]